MKKIQKHRSSPFRKLEYETSQKTLTQKIILQTLELVNMLLKYNNITHKAPNSSSTTTSSQLALLEIFEQLKQFSTPFPAPTLSSNPHHITITTNSHSTSMIGANVISDEIEYNNKNRIMTTILSITTRVIYSSSSSTDKLYDIE